MTDKQTHSVGEVVKAKHVQRPDGSEYRVGEGGYVLDAVGTFVVDGKDVEVR